MSRPLDKLTALWSATTMVPVNTGAAAAYRTLFLTMRRMVVGRRLTVRLDDGEWQRECSSERLRHERDVLQQQPAVP